MKKTYLNTLKPEEVIKRLKDGDVIHKDNSSVIIKFIDGVTVKEHGTIIIYNYMITIDEINDYYFEEEEKFEITETGIYKTREGKKAFVYEIDEGDDDIYHVYYIVENDGRTFSVTKQGRVNKYNTSPNDLVSKWKEV